MTLSSASFYITGGTLPRDAACYISRKADLDLLEGLRQGQFCYILTSRQMGKSSLMVRAATQLRQEGITCVVLDLTAVGQNLTQEQWYDGLLNLIARQLDLEDELEDFWLEHKRLGPLQRWMQVLRSVVLPSINTEEEKGRRGEGEAIVPPLPPSAARECRERGTGGEGGRLVIFIDEIDAVRSLPFSADEFFAAIRECYNRRTEDPDYSRLTFCLLGVATPSDLIRDTRTTPFNIGRRIELTDFTLEEALPLAAGLERERGREGEGEKKNPLPRQSLPLSTDQDASKVGGYSDSVSLSPPLPLSPSGLSTSQDQKLLTRILYWTGGQPYLTQRLCQAVSEALTPTAQHPTPDLVDRLCADLFLSPSARERDDNLLFVRDRLLRSEVDLTGLLERYTQVLAAKRVPDSETDPLVSVLRLSGVTRAKNGLLEVRNRIYRRVFDSAWVQANMPDADLRRQRSAYRQGVVRTAGIAAAIVLGMGVLAGFAIHEAVVVRGYAERLQRSELEALRESSAARKAEKRAREQQALAEQSARIAKQQQTLADKNARIAKENEAQSTAYAFGAIALSQRADREATKARRQESLARTRQHEAERNLHRALTAEQKANEDLLTSYLAQARAGRWSGRPGQRFDSLNALAHAAALHPTEQQRMELRNEAIACLALPVDLQMDPHHVWSKPSYGAGVFAYDPDRNRIFTTDLKGNVRVLQSGSGREPARLPGDGVPVTYLWRTSADGRYCVIVYSKVGFEQTRIWDLVRHVELYKWNSSRPYQQDFSPDSRQLAAADGKSVLIGPVGGTAKKRITAPDEVLCVRFSPDGHNLAILGYHFVQIHDLDSAKVQSLSVPVATNICLEWSPDGSHLAACCEDNYLYIWDVRSGARKATQSGHLGRTYVLAYSHRGDLLASGSDDGTVRLWDPVSGKQLLAIPVAAITVQFSQDDRRLILGGGNTSVWEVAVNREYHVLPSNIMDNNYTAVFSPDGRLLASGGSGITLWDTTSLRQVATLPAGSSQSVAFSPDGRSLYTCSGATGMLRWLITCGSSTSEKTIHAPDYLDESITSDFRFGISPDGRLLAAIHWDHVHLIDTQQGTRRLTKGRHPGLSTVSISPDDRWIACGCWQNIGVEIWDVRTGALARELPVNSWAQVAFSPDGRWLVTGSPAEYRFWQVGSWRPGPAIPRQRGANSNGSLAFTRDGSLLAVAISNALVQLFDPHTLRQIATLETPDSDNIDSMCFSPDGSHLVAHSTNFLKLWDLRANRAQLAKIGLDWQQPSYPPQDDAPLSPLRVTVQLPAEETTQRHRLVELDRQIARNPNNAEAHNDRGVLLLELGEIAKAADDFNAAANLNPNNAFYCNNLAYAYVRYPAKLNNASLALPLVLKAHRLAPNDWEILHTLGVVYYRLGQWDQALSTLQETVKEHGGATAFELFFQAMTCQRLGRTAAARDYYFQALTWWNSQSAKHPEWAADMSDFQTEAESVLGINARN